MLKYLQYCNLIKNKKTPEEKIKTPEKVNIAAVETVEKEALDNFDKLFTDIMLAMIPYKDENNVVFYDGNPKSPVMVIGEAPGEDEVIQKKPFVGKSGKLLQKMLDSVGLTRESVYVTNVVVWRPPNNRTPLPEEIDTMSPYLIRHIRLVKPKILILVGGVAAKCISGKNIAISRLRGEWFQYAECENVMSVFHPSYLLRSPIHKKETWNDIMQIRNKIIQLGYESILSKQSLLRS